MGNAPYFLTEDLEITAGINTDALVSIREEVTSAMNRAFSNEVLLRRISHQEGVDFFKAAKTPGEFVISADGGIYIPNPDIAYDSTRMYPDERGILEDKRSYRVMTRDGRPLSSQESIYIPENNRDNVGLCDDGLFSGDTLTAILSNLPNGMTKYKINVLLNFSSDNKLGGIPINAYYQGESIDWIDERDFYYGVMNSGASINPKGVVSGVPYISSPKMVSQKASIPKNMSKEFCITMLKVNQKLWRLIDENRLLGDVPRLRYLLERYVPQLSMQDMLTAEIQRIQLM